MQDRTRDSDEDEINDRDYDVTALANNLSQAFRYNSYDSDNADEVRFTIFSYVNFSSISFVYLFIGGYGNCHACLLYAM